MSSPQADARRHTPYTWAAGALALAAADVAVDPQHTHIPLCPLHAATGLSCPLCGGLRAVNALLHGQFAAAVRDNALLVAALPFVLVWWAVWVARAADARTPARLARPVRVLVAVAVVAFTIVRNLPAGRLLRPA